MTKPRQTRQESSEEIRSNIRRTRRRMDETLDELGERLHPKHLLDDAIDYFKHRPKGSGRARKRAKGAASRAGRAVAHQVKGNPLPSMLIGAGIAWLIADQLRSDDEEAVWEEGELYDPLLDEDFYATHGYVEDADFVGPAPSESAIGEYSDELELTAPNPTVEVDEGEGRGENWGDQAQHAKEHVSATSHAAAEKARAIKEQAKARAAHAQNQIKGSISEAKQRARLRALAMRREAEDRWHGAREKSRRAYQRSEETFMDLVETHPLSMGVGFLAMGVLAGLALPSSRPERHWMGETSRAVRRYAKATGEEMYDRSKETAGHTKVEVAEQLHAQELTPHDLKDKAKHVYREAVHAGKATAKEEGLDKSTMQEKGGDAAKAVKSQVQSDIQHHTDEMKDELRKDTSQ